jgi:hypothetical protein
MHFKDKNKDWHKIFAEKVYDVLMSESWDATNHDTHLVSNFSMVQKFAKERGINYVLAIDYFMRARSRRDCEEIFSDFAQYQEKGIEPVLHTFPVFEEECRQGSVNTMLIDECHMTEKGNALVAEQIYNFLIDNGWIEKVIEDRKNEQLLKEMVGSSVVK